jgi:hypothetical protein
MTRQFHFHAARAPLAAVLCLFLLIGFLLISAGLSYAQITPSADSYTNSADPTTNFGAKTLLDVDGASQTTYIQFNLSSIPSGATVSQATLKLYVNAVTTAGSFNVNYVSSAWSEGTVDFSNAPTQGAAIASNVAVTTADKNQYILINVTPAVQAWLSGSETNDGIALVANSTFNATFDSKENTTTSHAPELDIVFAGGIIGVTTASGSGLMGGGSSGTLNLALTNTCSSGQVLEWNGTAWACTTAKGTGTITDVVAGTDLTGGGTSGKVTLNLDTTQVPLLAGSNNFTQNNTFEPSTTDAIDAYTSGVGKTALVGIEYATSGGSYGVWAETFDSSGAGVKGTNRATSAPAIGVYGTGIYGVYGFASNIPTNCVSRCAFGLYGNAAVYGSFGIGAFGFNAATGSGQSGGDAILTVAGNADPNATDTEGGTAVVAIAGSGAFGGEGVEANGGNGSGSEGGDGPGGDFEGGFGSQDGDGIIAFAGSGLAALMEGNVEIAGSLSKDGGSFKIDHPLDPANKYLYHSFVESPDMMNIYNGNTTLDANGEAVIQMPEWFGVLNRDFRYQLTCIGGFAPLYIAEKLTNNQFRIGGGKPGMEVSWQITGIRQDAWANAHRIPVEEEKDARLKGYYINPELYRAPPEKQIEWARHPQMMKKMQERRQQMKEKPVRAAVSAKP